MIEDQGELGKVVDWQRRERVRAGIGRPFVEISCIRDVFLLALTVERTGERRLA